MIDMRTWWNLDGICSLCDASQHQPSWTSGLDVPCLVSQSSLHWPWKLARVDPPSQCQGPRHRLPEPRTCCCQQMAANLAQTEGCFLELQGPRGPFVQTLLLCPHVHCQTSEPNGAWALAHAQWSVEEPSDHTCCCWVASSADESTTVMSNSLIPRNGGPG